MKHIKTFENYDSFKMKDSSPHSKSDLSKISMDSPDAHFHIIIKTLSMEYPILRKFDVHKDKEGNLILGLFSNDDLYQMDLSLSLLITLKFENLGESLNLEYKAQIKLLEKGVYDDKEAELSNRFEDEGTYILYNGELGKEMSEAFVSISKRINKALDEFKKLTKDSKKEDIINHDVIDFDNTKTMLN